LISFATKPVKAKSLARSNKYCGEKQAFGLRMRRDLFYEHEKTDWFDVLATSEDGGYI